MEQKEEKTIIRINILQASMTLGTYLGVYIILVYIVFALAITRLMALSLLSIPLMMGIPVIAYLLVRRFREANSMPFFPFPVSWMITILTFLFATMLSCSVAYLYLRFIDNGALSAGLLARWSEYMQASDSITQTLTDAAQIEQFKATMDTYDRYVNWLSSLPPSGLTKQLIQTSLVWGNILSLIIALIATKRIRINR